MFRLDTARTRWLSLGLALTALAACTERADRSNETVLTDPVALVASGQKKARMCMGCHGPAGISRTAIYPSIAGLNQEYLSLQLQAFRNGDRKNPTMNSVAINLNDADIAALSHYYSSLPAPANK